MKLTIIALLLSSTFLFFGCADAPTPTSSIEPDVISNTETSSTEKPFYTTSELEKHNNKDDCWIAVSNEVYNMTSFILNEPHPEIIIDQCGKDASMAFTNKHGVKARNNLKNYHIGSLE